MSQLNHHQVRRVSALVRAWDRMRGPKALIQEDMASISDRVLRNAPSKGMISDGAVDRIAAAEQRLANVLRDPVYSQDGRDREILEARRTLSEVLWDLREADGVEPRAAALCRENNGRKSADGRVSEASARSFRWALGAASFLGLMVSAGLLWRYPTALLCLLVCLSAALCFMAKNKNRQVVISYVIGFILGPIGEYLGVFLGAWHYQIPEPDLALGIGILDKGYAVLPIWLPCAWGIASVTLWFIMDGFVGADEQSVERSRK